MAVTVHKTPALVTGVGVRFKWVFRTTAQVSLRLQQSAPHYVSSRPCCLLVPFNCWDLSAFQHMEGFLVNSQTTGPRNKKALIYGSSDKHAPERKCHIKDLCKIPYLLQWRTRVSFFFFFLIKECKYIMYRMTLYSFINKNLKMKFHSPLPSGKGFPSAGVEDSSFPSSHIAQISFVLNYDPQSFEAHARREE